MSAPQWKPGDVALIAWGNSSPMRALHISEGCPAPGHPDASHWHSARGGYGRTPDNVRPLVVIDPEDREQVERLVQNYNVEYDGTESKAHAREVQWMQAALRSLVTPPKPDEPQGLGAVVEDEDGARWARARCLPSGDLGHNWVGGVPARWAVWSEIAAVRVVTE